MDRLYRSEDGINRIAEILSKIQQNFTILSDENGLLRTENEGLKAENRFLLGDNNALVANNRELQARLEWAEKLKMVGKMLQEVQKSIDQKQNEDKAKEKKEEDKPTVAKQMGTAAIVLGRGGNIDNLESAKAEHGQQTEPVKLAGKLSLDSGTGEEELNMAFYWSTNRWYKTFAGLGGDHVRISEDGLTATKANEEDVNIRAEKPITRELLASISAADGLELVYFEVHMKKARIVSIGWVSLPTNCGEHDGSYVIDSWGDYWESGQKVADKNNNNSCRYDERFGAGDVVGSGVLLGRNNQQPMMKLFFTKNGRLFGKTITLASQHQQKHLFPAVSFRFKDTVVEANFGADCEKPFKFNANDNAVQLFE